MVDSPQLQAAARRRAVAAAIALTANTPLAPKRYERQLLARYQAGTLTIDEVLARLDTSIYHVLYHSRATSVPTETDLLALLDWSHTYNAQQQLTGLLLYSDGQFVQLLEGPEAAVRDLYRRIQQDTRHTQVVTLSDGPGPQRWFTEWSMAFGQVKAPELQQVLGCVATPCLVLAASSNPQVQTLLQAFGLPESEWG